tara:strand:- start:669 stop:1019 length:351 start_codon:yes stop_codon:yes gene_type:complete
MKAERVIDQTQKTWAMARKTGQTGRFGEIDGWLPFAKKSGLHAKKKVDVYLRTPLANSAANRAGLARMRELKLDSHTTCVRSAKHLRKQVYAFGQVRVQQSARDRPPRQRHRRRES